MKKAIITTVFIFSLALNLGVGAALVKHLWFSEGADRAQIVQATPLTPSDIRRITAVSEQEGWEAMRQFRQRIMEKNAEILNEIAANPTDPDAAAKSIDELLALKGGLERQSIERVRQIVASLPADRRDAFLQFMKQRTCMGPGMGMGRRGGGPMMGNFGRGHHMGGRGMHMMRQFDR